MNAFDNYTCDGQITITDYLAQKIERREVMDLTKWINSQGKCQFDQIEDVIRQTKLLDDEEEILIRHLTKILSAFSYAGS